MWKRKEKKKNKRIKQKQNGPSDIYICVCKSKDIRTSSPCRFDFVDFNSIVEAKLIKYVDLGSFIYRLNHHCDI